MPNLTSDEREHMAKSLQPPGPRDREYGHRGRITSSAIRDERTVAEADRWTEENAEPEKETR